METITSTNFGTTTSELKVEIYKELILICEMRIFQLQQAYEDSANTFFINVCDSRILIYQAVINRLSQRIITLKSNDTTLTRQKV